MILVILESPYAGGVERNVEYARACMRDCLMRGEAPYASHLLYTQPGVLDDTDPGERELGIRAGLLWGKHATRTVVYVDLGVTPGMDRGVQDASDAGREVVYRSLPCVVPLCDSKARPIATATPKEREALALHGYRCHLLAHHAGACMHSSGYSWVCP